MKQSALLALGILLLIAIIPLNYVNAQAEDKGKPWVYPASTSQPVTAPSPHWFTPLSTGTSTVSLILWNHSPNKDVNAPMFVIAIKSGLNDITIDSLKINGITVPVHSFDDSPSNPASFPPGGIFDCPWKEYTVSQNPLTHRADTDGWQGSGDTSGVSIEVTITVNSNPQNVDLFFIAYGTTDEGGYVHTPYSHLTETFYRPPNEVPEVPFGTIIAGTSMIIAFGAYFALNKKKYLTK